MTSVTSTLSFTVSTKSSTVAESKIRLTAAWPAELPVLSRPSGVELATASFAGGPQDIDVTQSEAIAYPTFAPGDSVFEAGQVTGTIDLGDESEAVEVETALGFITDLDLTIGGLSSGNISFLLNGAVEATANLADGRSIRLLPNQYAVTNNDGNDNSDLDGTENNVLKPGANAAVSGSDEIEVNIIDSDYWYAEGSGFDGSETINATYVTAGDISSATAGFRYYPDLHVVFTARRGNKLQDIPNQVPRSLELLFSNDSVENFRVAAGNAFGTAPQLEVNEDVGELRDLPAPTRWWFRPVIRAARVGEHMAVV